MAAAPYLGVDFVAGLISVALTTDDPRSAGFLYVFMSLVTLRNPEMGQDKNQLMSQLVIHLPFVTSAPLLSSERRALLAVSFPPPSAEGAAPSGGTTAGGGGGGGALRPPGGGGGAPIPAVSIGP